MTRKPLWSGLALVGALRARVSGGLAREASGVSIDTRTLQPGDMFLAIKGETRDGHEFVRTAFEKGASAAVIDEAHAPELSGAGPLFVVRDVQQSLESLGQRARERSAAFIVAVTGSVGKTSTKEMIRLMLSRFGDTHASAASYNNQWGVPLTLARMPAESRYGVFELGMNHAGEIAALVAQVRPHVAVVTRIAPVHLEYFGSIEKIADAKAEIFPALDGGVAIINRDDGFYERLAAAAAPTAGHVFSFGETEGADARLLSYETVDEGALVEAEIFERRLRFRIGAPGKHVAMNALAALLVGAVFDVDLEEAAGAFAEFKPPTGRGQREKISTRDGAFTLIDESYNANPTSMRAALQLLGGAATGPGGRRIAVLGDMLELGPQAAELHAELAPDLIDAKVDLLFTSGPLMSRLSYAAPDTMRAAHRATPLELEEAVLAAIRPGDVVMVKGSNGSRMSRIVSALKDAFADEMAN
ncbi:UDP-N-acetylmuramoylalanyl-D-glutamyl-2,6-diaminopimelate--D-alanyl-D-alanine ligase [Methylocystis sp. B8]|uniref:UDP-N-acetylmuramoylalanyl-D-glutamyl-2, 6-diaminopimelate--D-alanyl-D-alanine ligase n=1 Tax=Methylocystis sp. B8 TaxID=544938 RepID=UPI0010FDCDE5|nr:UDP-N-acetylmuramoylalanyl-D-glutamyl-2,6-diaminopimelate--D-alanyl-D-alanine ligase [Methylocystis sp. B8]TLG78911.1 UDP-N-acetylmuramoylalanyl-D-glutamyl-2,6-diaminopimelate--D-alanyl-D-alanine ligase [Methylocystis sp. B8]